VLLMVYVQKLDLEHLNVGKDGYTGDGFTCDAIDFCHRSPPVCATNADCTPTSAGGYTCACRPGFMGDGKSLCVEQNACISKPCDIHAGCESLGPSEFQCTCHTGYLGDGFACAEDISYHAPDEDTTSPLISRDIGDGREQAIDRSIHNVEKGIEVVENEQNS